MSWFERLFERGGRAAWQRILQSPQMQESQREHRLANPVVTVARLLAGSPANDEEVASRMGRRVKDPEAVKFALQERQAAPVHSHIDDVTDPAFQNLADRTQPGVRAIDVLVNNAGVGAVIPSEDLSLEGWSRVIGRDLHRPAAVPSQACVAGICSAARPRPVIINIGRSSGRSGMPMRAAHACQQHGLVGLTRVPVGRMGIPRSARGHRRAGLRPHQPRCSRSAGWGLLARSTSWLARPWGATASRPRSPLPSHSWPAMTRHSSPAQALPSTEAGWPTAAGRAPATAREPLARCDRRRAMINGAWTPQS